MFNFILKNIESFPNASFSENELIGISKSSFNDMKKQKCLTQLEYDFIKEPYMGDNIERFVRKENGRYFAYSTEEQGIEPIEIFKADLIRYQLSIPALFEKIRLANNIEGKFQEIKDGYFYVGYKLYDSFRVGFVFIPKLGNGQLVKFAGLQNLCKDDQVLVVFTPFTKIEDIVLNWTLSKCKITTTTLASTLDLKTFKLPIDDIIKEFVDDKGKIPALTKKEKTDYEKHNYQCQDIIEFLDEKAKYRNIKIKINDNKLDIPFSEAILFIFMAIKLKDNKEGYVSSQECEQESITQKKDEDSEEKISTTYLHNLVSKLSTKTLKNHASDGLIENLKHEKKYRISTHPLRIKAPNKNWLQEKYKELLEAVKAERKRRENWDKK
jgi:hypothetical protein